MSTSLRPLAVVTGASRGVGAALVVQALAAGHRVIGLARGPAAPAAAAHAGYTHWTLDLADAAPAAARLREALAATDPATVARVALVNNAAALSTPAALDQSDAAGLVRALRVGLEAPLLLSSAFIAATEAWRCPRRLMNVSSGLGRRAMAGSASYCAVKAGLDHFSRCVALEQAGRPNPVAVESIAPGVIDTDMQVQLRNADADRFPERARFAALHAQGQLATPEACARGLLARLDGPDFGREVITDLRAA